MANTFYPSILIPIQFLSILIAGVFVEWIPKVCTESVYGATGRLVGDYTRTARLKEMEMPPKFHGWSLCAQINAGILLPIHWTRARPFLLVGYRVRGA